MIDSFAGKYLIARPNYANEIMSGDFIFDEISRDCLISNFCEGLSIPKEPMVMPHIKKK